MLFFLSAAGLGFAARPAVAQGLTGGPDPAIQRELRYAEALNAMQLPAYARLVLDRIDDPAAQSKIKALRMRALASQGRFDDVKAIIAREPHPDSQEVWAMKLALADSYYAWGNYPEAQAIYESLFEVYPDGPPQALNDFYVDSAYRYARMLRLLKRRREAATAYDQVLKARLSKAIRRQVLAEKAEVLLHAAEEAAGAPRDKLLQEVEKLCEDILWVQDLWFGKAIVLLAHVHMLRGDLDGARELVEEYWQQLKELDALLARDEAASGEPLTQLSPMAECRYLLGAMMHDRAEALLTGGGDREDVIELLVGARKDPRRTERAPGAYQHLINVFIRYADTSWAPEAGRRAERIEALLEGPPFNASIEKKVTREQMKKVERLQFQGARLQFSQNQFADAAQSYERILNLFPEREASIAALGELARCYAELSRPLYADMVVRYLAERFARHPAYTEKAGDQLLRMASFYDERNQPAESDKITRLFLDAFPRHPAAPLTLFRFAEERFEEEAWADALAAYEALADQFPTSPLRFDALARIVSCREKQGKPVAVIKALRNYIAALEERPRPGPELIAARYREATALKELGPRYAAAAFNRLLRIEKLLTGADRSAYEQSADERRANERILQAALYNKAACYVQLPPPEGKTDAYRKQQAIQTLEQLVETFPRSEFAANALSQIGTLWTVLERPTRAAETLQRLQKDYPDSPQAKNALFMRGMNLLKMDRKAQAMAVFKQMFTADADYSAQQILTAGTELLNAGETAIALDAFNRVLQGSPERTVREPALLRKGIALLREEQFAAAAETLKTLLADYPRSGFTVEACLRQAQASSELGAAEPDAPERQALFNRAVEAMNRARKFETEPGGKARLDLETARLLHRRAAAARRFATPAEAAKDLNAAIAAYQKLILFGPRDNAAARPHIETAYFECIPLLIESEKWQDVVDDAEAYLESFREGRYVREIRTWRSQARVKLLSAGQLPGTGETEKRL